ncbi:hypothetical protein SAMN05421505_11328 [Sinosporangium album]|uniref:Uncharacterized protein n=1 Tax=Sinosporangium album TaxID=504805 RepID=A0A1G8AYC0_9ACTN|nr:hypothetical protein [Sinosporangium album]SDH25360.1 hypothetical protein SAMN05421505_11328 [Sinosporangium album]
MITLDEVRLVADLGLKAVAQGADGRVPVLVAVDELAYVQAEGSAYRVAYQHAPAVETADIDNKFTH